MKPFHLQYARHMTRRANRGIDELVVHLQSMINEANLLNSENIGAARAMTDGLAPILEKNRREVAKIKAAEKAKRLSKEALKAKSASLCASTQDVVESSTDSPAQADSASDDDGDGDGDPDPDRRRPGRPRNTRNSTFPAAAENFDRLPDSALVGIATVKALTSKSRATVYRWMDRGLFPRPCKIGTTHNLWRAGDIRRALSA